jgi:hypothetical protein
MSENRARVYAHVKQDRLIVENAESATPWSGSTDVTSLSTTTNHREGTNALTFSKTGTTEAVGQISRTFDSDNQLNLVDYIRGKIRFWINLSSLTDVASVDLLIGEDASNNYSYNVADTDLTTGWNEVAFDLDSPTVTNGNGAAWSSIGYLSVRVNFDAAGNTLSSILVDAISVLYELNTNVESINISGSGLATSANQSTMISSLQTIDDVVKSEDAVHSSGDAGVHVLGVRNDAGTALAADGDYTPLQTDSSGALRVTGGGISGTDDAAFAVGSTVVPIAGVADETSPDSVDEGDLGYLRMTLTRFLKTSLGDLISGEDQSNNVLQVVEKPLAVSTYTPDLDTSTAAEASSVTKASSGVLYGATFSNGNAAVRYFQFFNSTTVPADGTVPVITIQCPANSTVAAEWPEGRFFSTGIVWCNSSTQNTKTIGGADSLGDVNYK